MNIHKIKNLKSQVNPSNLDGTTFLSWAHFLPDMPQISNSGEIGKILAEMSKQHRLVIALDGMASSELRDYDLSQEFTLTSKSMQDILCQIPDGSIIVAGDPVGLHKFTLEDSKSTAEFETYLNAFATYAPTEHKTLHFLLRMSPGLSFLLYAMFTTDVRKISRRSFLKLLGLGGSSVVYFAAVAKWYSFAKEIQREKAIGQSDKFNQAGIVLDENIKTPFGIDQRVVMSLDKLNHTIQAINMYRSDLTSDLKPVAIFGSSHFLDNDYKSFVDEALDGTKKKELIRYASLHGDADLIYDLVHSVVLIKQTDPQTRLATLQGYNIPWVGSVINTISESVPSVIVEQ